MRRIFRVILALMVGYYIFEWWANQQQQQSSVNVMSENSEHTAMNISDPLTELEGIGPAYERALNALGIRTFAQLAAQNADDLSARLSSVRVTAARITRDQWIEQAESRANLSVATASRWSANDGNSA